MKTKLDLEVEAHESGYEEGYAAAEADMEREIDEAYREGLEEGAKEAEVTSIENVLVRATINPLEDFVGRWDAAMRAWILTQDGREMIVRKEG